MVMDRAGTHCYSTSDLDELTQRQGNQLGGGSESWFSSTISALLDSVPNSPAFASENALINRALQRMSSFGAGQTRAGNAATADATKAGERRGGQNGFLFISFLVGLGAVFWVLTIGTAVKVLRGLWNKFISS